jgi:hypothetical protein
VNTVKGISAGTLSAMVLSVHEQMSLEIHISPLAYAIQLTDHTFTPLLTSRNTTLKKSRKI